MATTSVFTEAKIKSTLAKHAKHGSRSQFMVGEDNDGELWYTNSYYAAKMDATTGHRQPVGRTFMAAYNLEPASGSYPLNGTLQASTHEGPRIGPLLPDASVWVDAERVEVVGQPVLVDLATTGLCRLYGPSSSPVATDKPIAINDDYATWLEKTAGVTAWKSQGDNVNKPMGGFNDAGELVAIVMPVRIH